MSDNLPRMLNDGTAIPLPPRRFVLESELAAIRTLQARSGGLLHQSDLARRARAITYELEHGQPAPKRQPPEHWHAFGTGDKVTHKQYGKGEIIYAYWSPKLRINFYTVRYEGGDQHTSMAADLEPDKEQ